MDPSHFLPVQMQNHFRPEVEKHDVDSACRNPRPQDARSGAMRNRPRKVSRRKTLVLCFDGTGNRFHGDASDSNILKIFRMLDRSGNAFHYYQPGIGTYVTSDTLSTHSSFQKIKNWYIKAKDSAVGTSFGEHVVGGYKFLMRYYSPGDNIYIFGFSRGSYTARFLAEMIDWVGLISHGNEEMILFAWRTFSKWKAIDSYGEEAMRQQRKAYEFMVAFRETFSRPVRRIRFLGLFDTVNSVPRFENAMMGRPHMPYTARSSAKVIRHAVSIDERRAKFRSDLISEEGRRKKETDEARAKHMNEKQAAHEHTHNMLHHRNRYKKTRSKRRDDCPTTGASNKLELPSETRKRLHRSANAGETRYRAHSRSRSPSVGGRLFESYGAKADDDGASVASDVGWGSSLASYDPDVDCYSSDSDGSDQDIDELWFPGGHADIGGGWEDAADEEVALSHVPLVWIAREAKRSGLEFDMDKMKAMGCWDDSEDNAASTAVNVPTIEISTTRTGTESTAVEGAANGVVKRDFGAKLDFKTKILHAATRGRKHDCLAYGQGLPSGSVLSWRIMEYIPFRRMDLRDDGSWKPIRWPLPRGEVRDMPSNAKVHHSAIKRMEHDPKYRPGNLILGGGGRGRKTAPKEAGIGAWEVVAEEGDIVGERVRRVSKTPPNGASNGK